MKSLLRTVLVLCVFANVLMNFAVPDGVTQVVLSAFAGLCALACGAGLWFLRDRRPEAERRSV
ncbi:hypothetical protein [Streptomyces iconiensis]|uniref:Uncharacterized protein n=1 Tax=Streptomyces iconiensis TaxID=1384038 RepID=A0ABT6ZQS5_9ACTN|nr:hypothetical protein [Streptomyces iconiensis]MDJ1131406.1 hypothetical protein [Streptomyces iconiensis]